ncbi:TetR/AcrR family transcriptional regulator [Modestobacter marinus]|uniref:TetR/AcrR family transcriptional regulator n=1 Tax=Modestobacter marinus TaxID=477641 RepID=UPI001C93C129|nr:TetR/AcrR family transcriptional regulator [Modestobacter marinus]
MGSNRPRTLAREQRRRRIEQAALELFRAKGFDQVTVEEVCAAAEAAPATFYRHFGSKEEVVFAYRDDFTAAMQDALSAVAGLPEAERLPVVLARFAEFLESQQEVLALRDEIVLGHPRLMQRTLSVQRDLEAVLAAGLAGHRGAAPTDPAALLEAGVGLLVLRVAVRRWRAGGRGSLSEMTQATLADLYALAARDGGS